MWNSFKSDKLLLFRVHSRVLGPLSLPISLTCQLPKHSVTNGSTQSAQLWSNCRVQTLFYRGGSTKWVWGHTLGATQMYTFKCILFSFYDKCHLRHTWIGLYFEEMFWWWYWTCTIFLLSIMWHFLEFFFSFFYVHRK